MPRYDDRYGSTRLYVGRLSSRTRSRDLEYLFSRYGRVRDVELKHDYAFVEFSDPRDADDARYSLNGRDLDGSRLLVEFARGGPRGSRDDRGGSRGGDYGGGGRGPPPGSGRCFNCGIDGHWARDCKAGDWKNKCYRCGERGHIERNCQNSPKSLKRDKDRSYSRSPSPRRGRSYSRSRSRSYSRSRSPRRERSLSRDDSRSRSPVPKSSRKHSASPMEDRSRSRSPVGKDERNGDGSPRRDASRSPRDVSPAGNGRSPSPAANGGGNGDDSRRGSESPDN